MFLPKLPLVITHTADRFIMALFMMQSRLLNTGIYFLHIILDFLDFRNYKYGCMICILYITDIDNNTIFFFFRYLLFHYIFDF